MPSAPGAGVDMPPPPWRRNEAPAPAAAPPAPAIGGGGEIPWYIRNGFMQRDPNSGDFIDPELAKRAMGSF
jgi:hypothetical protein